MPLSPMRRRLLQWMTGSGKSLSGALTAPEIAEIFGCSLYVVSVTASEAGFNLRNAVAFARRAPINWDLPGRDLGEIWFRHISGETPNGTSRRALYVARLREEYGRQARWRHNPPDYQCREAAYRLALAAEKRNAVRWFRENPGFHRG